MGWQMGHFGTRSGALAALCLSVGLLAAGPAGAQESLLVVHNPALGPDRGKVHFSRDDLEALDWREITTGNQFITGDAVFRGPRVADALALIGHAGAKYARLVSAAGRHSDILISELQKYEAILALEMNGRALTLRDFGPIWVMYPMNDHSELEDSRFNNRLVWQLQEIELF